MATCVGPPSSILLGSIGVFISYMPAARMGDPTAHGGVIVMGSPNVLIGDLGMGTPGTAGMAGVIAGLIVAKPQDEDSSWISQFGSGVWDSTIAPLGHMVAHPIDTAEGIGHAIAHPIQTGKAIGKAVVGTAKGVLSGDPKAIGTAVGTIGMMVIPGAGEADAAEDAARVSEAADAAKAADAAEGAEAGADAGKAGALPKNPDDLLNQGYVETSHPDAAAAGHRTFTNPETGDTVRFDEGTPGQPGYEGVDHYHRDNPNSTGKSDTYLDKDGNPVPKGSKPSHLLPDEPDTPGDPDTPDDDPEPTD